MADTHYPHNVPTRRHRPRESNKTPTAVLGALVGLLATRTPAEAALGGVLGAAVANDTPMDLEQAVRDELLLHRCDLVEFYRQGPYRISVLFRYDEQYWTLESHAPSSLSWTQESLEDWLFGDLVDVQLLNKLREINGLSKR